MRDIVIAMFMMGTLPMALVRPMVGLMLWLLFSYMNPHRMTWGFAYTFPWVFLAAALTLFSLIVHPEERQKIPWKFITVLLFVFLLWTGVTTLSAVQGAMAQSKWVTFLKIQMMAFATLVLVKDRQRLHWVLWVIVLSFGFWGLKSGVFTVLTGGSYHIFGPRGTFFRDNNQFALVMCMTLPLMRYLQLQDPRKWVRRGMWVLMGLTALSVLGTYSRGGMLALAAMLSMLALKSRYKARLVLVVVVLAPLMFALMPQQWKERMVSISHYKQSNSAMSRIRSWEFATNVARANPATGGGFLVWSSDSMWDQYGPPKAGHRAIHSIFFEVLGEHGFIGLGLFLALIAVAWHALGRIVKRSRDSPDTRWMSDLAGMIQVSMIGYLAAGAFLAMPYFDLFYQLLALTVVLQVFAVRESVARTVSTKAGGLPGKGPLRPVPASGAPGYAASMHNPRQSQPSTVTRKPHFRHRDID